MKLTVGSQYFGRPLREYKTVQMEEVGGKNWRWDLTELSLPHCGRLARYREMVREVVVGYVDGEPRIDLDFLSSFPSVGRVWVVTDQVKDITGLRFLAELHDLAIDRPTCRMDVLGELHGLRSLYIDDWRPGAASVLQLEALRSFGVQKFPYPNLERIAHWGSLEGLSFNGGRLEELTGIPRTLRTLRLSNQRKLWSVCALMQCAHLESLSLEGCRRVSSIDGLSGCHRLRMLCIEKCDLLESLEPLGSLENLEHVALGRGVVAEETNVDALYTLPRLSRLIVPKRSGLAREKLLEAAPGCELILTTA